jgi:hypothetical protein
MADEKEKKVAEQPKTSPKFRLGDDVEISNAEGMEAFYNGCKGKLIGITHCIDEVMRAYLVRFDVEGEEKGIVNPFKETWILS